MYNLGEKVEESAKLWILDFGKGKLEQVQYLLTNQSFSQHQKSSSDEIKIAGRW